VGKKRHPEAELFRIRRMLIPALQDDVADTLGVTHREIGRLEYGETVKDGGKVRQGYRKWLRARELPLENYLLRLDRKGAQAQKLRWARVILNDSLRAFAVKGGQRGSKTRRSIWFWSEFENGRIELDKRQAKMVAAYIATARAELARLMRREEVCKRTG